LKISLHGKLENTDNTLINMKELCRRTSLSKAWFYEMISEKRLPFPVYRFGRALRFRQRDVEEWIEARRQGN